MGSVEKPVCPDCNSKSTIKKGKRRNKQQTVQKYKCKDCNKIFTLKVLKHKLYSSAVILNALAYYNLGYNLEETSSLINRRYKVNTSAKTVQLWVDELKEELPYSKFREQAQGLYNPKNILFKKPLMHQQVYLFQYHKAKLHLLFHSIKYNNMFTNQSKFYVIKDYLQKIPTKDFPHHIFKSQETKIKEGITNILEQRASQLKFSHLKINHIQKQNQANKLAKLALETAKTKSKAHEAIERFFLMNDSTTIAVEVPVYLTNDDIKYFRYRKFKINLDNYATPITGHIDILQIRNGLIYIMDYKPFAEKILPIEQLTIYALALASRTKLALRYFKCAWFDENSYFEFFPLHAVYEKSANKNLVMMK